MLLEKWPSRLAPCRVGTNLQIVKKKMQFLLGAMKQQGMLVILIHECIVFLTSSPFLLFL